MTNQDLEQKLLAGLQPYFLAFLRYPNGATLTLSVTDAKTSATLTLTPSDHSKVTTGADNLAAHFDEAFNKLSIALDASRQARGVSVKRK